MQKPPPPQDYGDGPELLSGFGEGGRECLGVSTLGRFASPAPTLSQTQSQETKVQIPANSTAAWGPGAGHSPLWAVGCSSGVLQDLRTALFPSTSGQATPSGWTGHRGLPARGASVCESSQHL